MYCNLVVECTFLTSYIEVISQETFTSFRKLIYSEANMKNMR